MLLSEFWTRQRFSYLVTYSFQRGAELTALKEQLRQQLNTARYMQRPAIQQQLSKLEHPAITLTEGLGAVHPTASAVMRLASHSAEVQQLTDALVRASKQECYAMCLPIYRDALAFNNEADELVSVLNICFQCLYMQTNQQEHVEADMATYDFLQTFLLRLGYPITAHE
jgi:hypothetical protein